jgi:hypothetical protein
MNLTPFLFSRLLDNQPRLTGERCVLESTPYAEFTTWPKDDARLASALEGCALSSYIR